jgi:glycine/sarcosine N-methyltransferase
MVYTMSFYEQLGAVYDEVFPENPAITSFLSAGMALQSRMLDLACGTGTYACALTEKGHNVTGIDLDNGMIEQAKQKAAGKTIRFFTGDMTAFDTLIAGETFNRIYCIGNSLSHLNNRETVLTLCSKAYAQLRDNGDFILQIVNFAAVLAGQMNALPVIEKTEHGLRFLRSYRLNNDNDSVSFHGELTRGEESWKDSVRLLTLDRDEMVTILNTAGFQKIETFGGYNGAAFSNESPALVIKTTR